MRSSWVIFEVVIVNMHALYLFFISEIASKTFTMLKLYNNLSTYTYTCVCVYICVWIYHYCGCLRNTNAIQYFNRLSSSRESHGGIIVYSPTHLLSPFHIEWRQFASLLSSNIFCYKLFFSMVTQIFASHFFSLIVYKVVFYVFHLFLSVSYCHSLWQTRLGYCVYKSRQEHTSTI